MSAAKGIVTAKVVYCVSVPYNSTLPVVVHSAVVESLASTAFSYSYSAKVTVDIRSCLCCKNTNEFFHLASKYRGGVY